MDLSPPPPPSSPSSLFHIPLHSSSSSSFPVIAIALIGILATAFLLVGYYVFVIKCCLNWHRIDVLNRFYSRRRNPDDPTTNLSSSDGVDPPKGLDESIIRSIPVIKFRKLGMAEHEREKADPESYECAVCLSEFEDGEKLRVIPNCCHAFHIDCIDIWLQGNANCPLCRSAVSLDSILYANNEKNQNCGYHISSNIYATGINKNPDNFSGDDEDYVVIEIQGNNLDEPRLVRHGNPSQGGERIKGRKKLEHICSLGDEWIDMRGKNDEFQVAQPIRRSISMDLSVDREFRLEIQQCCSGITSATTENCGSSSSSSSGSKVRRSIFSFGYGRSSRGSVQPLHLDS